MLPTSSPGCETTLGTRVRFASYLLQSLGNTFNATDKLSLLHKTQPIIIEENTKAVSPLKQQVFSLNACLWLLFLPSKILVFKCSVNVLFYYHHKLYISLNSYKGLTTLKESLRAAKRPLENVIKTFPSNSVRV